MQTDRYDYSPIIKRKPLKWPNGARVALMVAPNIEFFHVDKVIPGAPSSQLPDVTGYALRDYGSRIGVFRMMDVLDKHGIRATVLLNADVCAHHPAIIEEGNKRNWEWLGHGVTNNIRINQYPLEEERAIIRQIRETIAAATGKAPRGWLGPGGGDESPNTLDHLAPGIDVSGNVFINSEDGFLYELDSNGRQFNAVFTNLALGAAYTPLSIGPDGRIYAQNNGHLFVIGLAFRIKYLDEALKYICARERVWKTTGAEIADYFYANYYQKP